jgi:UDP-2-acetamido-3-amino-2,3-dideoxy-glucuronate N-acetyltransferase
MALHDLTVWSGAIAVENPQVHQSADVDDRAALGPGTIVWHLAQIREHARLGSGCIVGRGAYVGPGGLRADAT